MEVGGFTRIERNEGGGGANDRHGGDPYIFVRHSSGKRPDVLLIGEHVRDEQLD